MKYFSFCIMCGNVFVFPRIAWVGRKFTCCSECSKMYRRIWLKEIIGTKKSGITKQCQYCNKEFYTYPSRLKRRGRNVPKYCSKLCADKARIGMEFPQRRSIRVCIMCGAKHFAHNLCGYHWRKEYSKTHKRRSFNKKCDMCGADYSTTFSPQHFCTRKCYWKYKQGKPNGRAMYTSEQRRLINNLRTNLKIALKRKKLSCSLTKLVGSDIGTVTKRLENMFYRRSSGEVMSWDNYGYWGWHVDHIRPICSFDISDIDEVKKAFHYTNLQPLWREDNQRKSSKY